MSSDKAPVSSYDDEIEIEFVEVRNEVPHLRGPEWIVSEFSTDHNVLPMDEVTLVGLAGRRQNLKALLRLASGEIVCARDGDHTAAGEVVAVLEDNVLLKTANGGFQSLYIQPDTAPDTA